MATNCAASMAQVELHENMITSGENVFSEFVYVASLMLISVKIGSLAVHTMSLRISAVIFSVLSLMSLLAIWYMTERHNDREMEDMAELHQFRTGMKISLSVLFVGLQSIIMGARHVVWTSGIIPGDKLASAVALTELFGLIGLMAYRNWSMIIVTCLICLTAIISLLLVEPKVKKN